MTTVSVRTPAEYESRLQRYLFERSEESRAVRVGEKETSDQASIVERYTDLFSREQLDGLRATEEQASDPDERERLYRLRKTCEGGLIAAELTARQDELENGLLAERVSFEQEELPLRSAQAKLAVLPSYADREELGALQARSSAGFNPDRLELIAAGEALEAELTGDPDPIARSEEEKRISLRDLSRVLFETSEATEAKYLELRERWFGRLLGPDAEELPSSYHVSYVRRLSPLESTYTKDRATRAAIRRCPTPTGGSRVTTR